MFVKRLIAVMPVASAAGFQSGHWFVNLCDEFRASFAKITRRFSHARRLRRRNDMCGGDRLQI